LREAIDSVLAQSFTGWELVLTDNASTDATATICLAACTDDPRIRYLPSNRNQGLAANFNRACKASRGEFIVWMGCDDRMHEDYLTLAVDVLRTNPDAVLCFPKFNYIDEDGLTFVECGLTSTGESKMAASRLLEVLFDNLCDPIFGVMRAEIVKTTRLHGNYPDSDRVLLAEMAMRGRFVQLNAPLFSRRMHRSQTTTTFEDRRARAAVFDPRYKHRPSYPWLRELKELIAAAWKAPVTRRQRLACMKPIYWWALAHRKHFSEDVRYFFYHLFFRRRPNCNSSDWIESSASPTRY
jgi:glycosyltransferase involved in cell wall biosynthesis